ncbi:GNAT family N-acetyltransferase [Thermoleptolyngbya sp. M55_K2018_002]|uniref:GNAT family N-acetyltransferase n=1 Tax=Thermoleptolyngbya sp. M55_K2018_002 TaxID=2747808 RepID=UPI0019FE3DBC|nr:GNAT family N-acetyltransferase [Thermoleptolyngbya sp. M55_K2018_002]HIK39215.1 N-acetyltransferase [Thermoleptolyngbya sp. M55_K2018_002]
MIPQTPTDSPLDNLHIRPATEADVLSILTIYNDAILHTTAVYDYEPHTLEMRQSWFAARQTEGYPILVAVNAAAASAATDDAATDDAEILGYAALGPFRAWAAYRYTAESSVYVAAPARGRGIGQRLLAPLIEAAKARSLHTLIAGIDADNTASLRLHQRFGYAEVGHLRQVGYKFDRWLDLKFLQLLL